MTKLFRAVGKDEIEDIKNYRIFRTVPLKTLEAKQFTFNLKDANYFGKELFNGLENQPFQVIEVEIPNELLDKYDIMSLDGRNCVSIDEELLEEFNKFVIINI
ncbi:MAG: hypothetical protein ACKVOU_03795 [Cytophagales bacterium]